MIDNKLLIFLAVLVLGFILLTNRYTGKVVTYNHLTDDLDSRSAYMFRESAQLPSSMESAGAQRTSQDSPCAEVIRYMERNAGFAQAQLVGFSPLDDVAKQYIGGGLLRCGEFEGVILRALNDNEGGDY